jgi:glutathione S-transferase
MRLYSSPPSAYSRKVRIVALELGIADRIEVCAQSPRDNSGGSFAINPLARIPVLVTDDGVVLYDSPVICDYLNNLVHGALIPGPGSARWEALRRPALGDGMLDWGLPLSIRMTVPT